MKAIDRVRKQSAISKLLQGDRRAIEALRPKMMLDLDALTNEELEFILKFCPSSEDGLSRIIDLPKLEQAFGRKLHLIPSTL